MKQIRSFGYNIYIGQNACKQISTFLSKKKYASLHLLCDNNTFKYCLKSLCLKCPELAGAQIIKIQPGESSKYLNTCEKIWHSLNVVGAGRDALLINLGGGVVSDVGGFCASVYKRGIDFINVPTSLLAMADASVGGKTGIDFKNNKNMLGTFNQPKGVFIDPSFLSTLQKRHFNNGMAEVYKIAIVADKKLWNLLKTDGFANNINEVVKKSVMFKNNIVLKDPFDHSYRKILNFGHTIGHAIESYYLSTPSPFLHGECVMAGMLIELHLSLQKNLINQAVFDEVFKFILKKANPKISALSYHQLIKYIKNDKKIKNSEILCALPISIGEFNYKVAVNEAEIKKAITFYNKLLS